MAQALAQNRMNKIKSLFDEVFVRDFFRKELLKFYPGFIDIGQIKITPYKNMVWETTYHVVLSFKVRLLGAGGEEKDVSIVCSAHSSEERKNVYDGLSYLWGKDFPNDEFDLPKPLFYSEYFRGVFYQAIEGENLLYYIKERDWRTVEKMIKSSGTLFARLHSLPAEAETNFNPYNARIPTVIPGIELIFKEMGQRYDNKYNEALIKIYDRLIAAEDKFFSSGQPLTFIHGDAHAENIIKTGRERIGLIDFTDLCLADFARDLGTFLQQVEYKIVLKIGRKCLARRMKRIFLRSYLKASGRQMTKDLRARINLYYNWTAVRTATFYFLKFGHDEVLAKELLEEVKKNLKI